MKKFNLILEKRDGESTILEYEARKVLLGGFTGRNKEAVIKHIEELENKGIKIKRPEKFPIFYKGSPFLLTTSDVIEVPSEETSGEVEYVIMTAESGKIYIAVGSDHTDRDLEKINIQKSKWICPKVLSTKIWDYNDLKDHWDRIEMFSYIIEDGKRELYQSGKLETLLTPNDLLKEAGYAGESGWVVYSGTLATLRGIVYSQNFEVGLFDPILNRKIVHRYTVKVLK
jgi:hypothetical protein